MRAVVLVTVATHLTFALTAAELMRIIGVPMPALAGIGAALALLGLFARRMRALYPDRARSAAALHLIRRPYFAHWCAALGACLPDLGLCRRQGDGVGGARAKARLPTTFALVAYAVALAVAVGASSFGAAGF